MGLDTRLVAVRLLFRATPVADEEHAWAAVSGAWGGGGRISLAAYVR